jgi:uncharacterized protein YkwD
MPRPGAAEKRSRMLASLFPAVRRLLVAAPVAAVILGGLLPAMSSASATTTDLRRLDALSSEVVTAVNDVRAAKGLPRLRLARPLSRAADSHTASMATVGFFGHDSPSGETFARRIRRFYPGNSKRSWTAGENLLATTGDIDARAVVDAWLASPAHRKVLLKRGWSEIGVAAIYASSPAGVFGGAPTVLVAAEFGMRY